MKLRYLFVFICLFLVNINYVDASSIEYNLTIDDDVNFIENNIYKIDKSDIDRTSYNHITSILDDDIYFDNDKTILYKKEKTNNGDFYTVSLKHKYSTYFFNNSRIINECFEWAELKSNVDSISFRTKAPFLCSHRADTILINIITNLDVVSNNADYVNGNKYTWNVNGKSFVIDMKIKLNQSSDEDGIDHNDMAGFHTSENDMKNNLDDDGSILENKKNDEKENEKTSPTSDSDGISFVGVGITLLVIFVVGIIAFVILNSKKKSLDKI